MRSIMVAALFTLLAASAWGDQQTGSKVQKSPAPAAQTKPAPTQESAPAQPTPTPSLQAAPSGSLQSEDQKTLYAVGLALARQLEVFDLTSGEFEIVKQGLTDGISGKAPVVNLEAYGKKIQELAVARRNAQGAKLATKAREYYEKASKEKGAVKTDSGLIYLSLRDGTGPTPTPEDKVKVNYRGTFADGKEFDSSYKRGQPVEIPLNGVIKCWSEGLQMMKTGGKAQLVCTPSIAYGPQGSGIIPANAMLVFEVELLDIVKK